ncbi:MULTISPECIES: sensor histidine kinase [unclassified Paenibacillus]|uniref:sensor histidine kinase n=1 Tax=unclassified Paenibacillus TaxID=185978 RepID=UPI000839C41F|nr:MULTISPECIES: ATP-binding protein [unclassified Paenibacillus]NWL88526.1 sensor histidine kinase [Paenibacillus sp. 79R4]
MFQVALEILYDCKKTEQVVCVDGNPALNSNMSAVIMHEVRNSLTVTRGFIQLLQPHFRTIGREEYARVILLEIDKACEMLQDFMTYSRLRPPERIMIEGSELFGELGTLASSQAFVMNCEIELIAAEESLPLLIDLKLIKQVMLNLIKNAAESVADLQGRRPGIIQIRMEKEGEFAKFAIGDNGNGIAAEVRERLFEPFVTTKEKGTGLGLAVSQQIVNDHGGTIGVSSTIGEGTIFEIYLPLAYS